MSAKEIREEDLVEYTPKEMRDQAKEEFKRTKDILWIKKLLRHKNIRSTWAFLKREKLL